MMKLKLTWWQRVALRALLFDKSFEPWLRERALNLPLSKKQELKSRLNVSLEEIDAVQTAIQDEAVSEFQHSLG